MNSNNIDLNSISTESHFDNNLTEGESLLRSILHGGSRNTLHTAAMEGNINEISSFLKNGANPNEQDNNGDTPLHIAVKAGNNNVVDYLIQNGGDPTIRNNNGQYVMEQGQSGGSRDSGNDILSRTLDMMNGGALSELPFTESDAMVGGSVSNNAVSNRIEELMNGISQAPMLSELQGTRSELERETDVASHNAMSGGSANVAPVRSHSSIFMKSAESSRNDAHSATSAFIGKVLNDLQTGGFDNNYQSGGSFGGSRKVFTLSELPQEGGDLSATSSFPVDGYSYSETSQSGGFPLSETSASNSASVSHSPELTDGSYSNSYTLSDYSDYSRESSKASDKLHTDTMTRIKEILGTDDDVLVRSYKAAVYSIVKEKHPELNSSLDRAQKMYDIATTMDLTSIDKKGVDEIYDYIAKRDKERAEKNMGKSNDKKDKPVKEKKTTAKKATKDKKAPKAKKVAKPKKVTKTKKSNSSEDSMSSENLEASD